MKISSIVFVFDQAIYSKAIETKRKEKEKFKNAVLMIGMFHTIMYMHFKLEVLSDAGLRDVFIQKSTIAEGCIDKALSGKMYNRGIRACQLMY